MSAPAGVSASECRRAPQPLGSPAPRVAPPWVGWGRRPSRSLVARGGRFTRRAPARVVDTPPFADVRGVGVAAVAGPPVGGGQFVDAASLRAAQHAADAHPVGKLASLDPLAGEAVRDSRLVFRAGDP